MIEFDYITSTGKLLIKCEEQLFSRIREHFSVENANSAFIKRRNRFASTRKYAITPTGKCDLGLFWEIRKYLITKQVTLPVNITDSLKKIIEPNGFTGKYTGFAHELRDYQVDVIEKCLKLGTGTCVLGTGAGKTLTTAALIENFYLNASNKDTYKCLVVVPDLGLVTQTYDEFITSGTTFKATKWTGKNDYDPEANVIICNAGVLQSRFDDTPWIKYVDLLVVDECHRIKHDNKISKLISKIRTNNKFGFTGTLPEDQFDKWSIIGKLGPVIYEKSSYDLRKEKYLTNVEVKVIRIQYSQQVPKLTENKYKDELTFIYNHEQRNSLITKLTEKLDNNTLILVNHIEHGEILHSILTKNTDKEVYFIRGSVEVEERERIKQLMEKNSNIVCVAISAIFSTGVNIKNLHNILFVSGGKSFIRTVQSIGRGLRLHESKEKLTIIDLADSLRYGSQHSDKRMSIYEQEKIKFTVKGTAFH